MMQSKNESPWRSILLLLLSGIACIIFLCTGLVMSIAGLFAVGTGDAETATSTLMFAGGMVVLGLVLIPSVYYSFMHILDRPARPLPFNRVPTYVLVIAWTISAAFTILIDSKDSSSFLLILFNLVTIILPIWILVRIGLRGLDAGSPERQWGTFTVGLTIVPFIIGLLEIFLLMAAGIAAFVWVMLNPESLNSLENLSTRLLYTSNPDTIIKILSPYFFNPAVIILGLMFFSILVPVVEETIKPLGVWLGPKRLASPEQGFAIGVLCGAAYALMESLGIMPGLPETSNLLSIVRAGTDLLHVATTGLMGWALVSAWRERKFLQLGLIFLLVISLHGLWNAFALFSSTQLALANLPNPSQWGQALPVISIIGLGILTLSNLFILYSVNHKFNQRDAE